MKTRIILFIVAIFLCGLTANSQIYTPETPTSYGNKQNRQLVLSALGVPSKDTVKNTTDSSPQIFYRNIDSTFWGWSQDKGFFQVGGNNNKLFSNYYTRIQVDSIALLKQNIVRPVPLSGSTINVDFASSWQPNQAIIVKNNVEVGFVEMQFPQPRNYPNMLSGDIVEFQSLSKIDTLYLSYGGYNYPRYVYNFPANAVAKWVFNKSDSTWYGGIITTPSTASHASNSDSLGGIAAVNYATLNGVQTVINKTLSGASNTFSNIPETAITNLTTDLAAKANDASVVHKTGALNETVYGDKWFQGTTMFGTANAVNSIAGLYYNGKPAINLYFDSNTGRGGLGANTWYNDDSSKYKILTAGWGSVGTILETTPSSGLRYARIDTLGNVSYLFQVDAYSGQVNLYGTPTDAVGNFITRNNSTGALQSRTAAEALTDIGAQPLENQRLSTTNNVAFNRITTNDSSYIKNTPDAIGNIATINAATGLMTHRTSSEIISDLNVLTVPVAATTYTPQSRTINGLALSSNINLTASLVGAVDTSYHDTTNYDWNFIPVDVRSTYHNIYLDTTKMWMLGGNNPTISNGHFIGYNGARDSLEFRNENNRSGWITDISRNTAWGEYALTNPSGYFHNGQNNTAIGFQAGSGKIKSDKSVYLGAASVSDIDSVNDQIVIGYNAHGTKSYQAMIGDTNILETVVHGIVKVGKTDTLSTFGNTRATSRTVADNEIAALEDSVLNRDYSSDSVAIVNGGLSRGDFYKTGNSLKIVTAARNTYINYINWTVNSTDTAYFRLDSYSTAFNMTIDWGDGNTTTTTKDTTYYTIGHKYASVGKYVIKVTPTVYTGLKEFLINYSSYNTAITNVQGLDHFTSFALIGLNQGQFNNIDSIVLPSSLTELDSKSNAQYFKGFNPVVPLPSNLTTLKLTYNNLTSFSPSVGLPATLTTLDIRGNYLNSAAIDNFLIWLDGLTFNAGAKTAVITMSTAAPPTNASSAALSDLTSKGWTITHD